MRKFVVAGIFVFFALAAGVPANAAPKKLPPPTSPSPTYDWSGLYGGVNLGADWGHSTVTPALGVPFPVFTDITGFLITPAQIATLPPASAHATSIIGGAQAGYNWQSGRIVYGLEGDIDGTGLRERSASTLSRTTISGTQTVTANFSANIDWIASIRGRLGYAADRTLLYVTGGLAVAGTTLNTTYAIVEPPQPLGGPFPGTVSSSHAIAGWTAGLGGDWAIDRAWSASLEYRHSGFSVHGYNIGFSDNSLIPFVGPGSATVRFNTDQVTARLSYHFH